MLERRRQFVRARNGSTCRTPAVGTRERRSAHDRTGASGRPRAMCSVDPRLAEPTEHVQAWANVEQREKRFEITIYHADGLFRRFEKAIRDALGPAVDLIGVGPD